MTQVLKSWRYFLVGCAILLFAVTTTVMANDDDEQGKGKGGKGKKGTPAVVQKGKGGGKGASALQLPPGLAKKPADHPGRVAWLKAHSGAATKKASDSPSAEKRKKGEPETSDFDRRIERLLTEIEALRREMKGKKK